MALMSNIVLSTLCLSHKGEVVLSWTPSEEQTGIHIACVVAIDMHSTPSTPYCLPLIASTEDNEVYA